MLRIITLELWERFEYSMACKKAHIPFVEIWAFLPPASLWSASK